LETIVDGANRFNSEQLIPILKPDMDASGSVNWFAQNGLILTAQTNVLAIELALTDIIATNIPQTMERYFADVRLRDPPMDLPAGVDPLPNTWADFVEFCQKFDHTGRLMKTLAFLHR